VVERGDLGDHPADADPRQVRRPVVESAGERRGVAREIAQRVRGRASTHLDLAESDGDASAVVPCTYLSIKLVARRR
jgi:hypothetical protein